VRDFALDIQHMALVCAIRQGLAALFAAKVSGDAFA
jgi:hypothetical protein